VKASDIPNLISILRIILVAPTVYYLINEKYLLALILFFIAGASDGLDGFLARYFRWQSRLGALLDPIGDKLLLVCCYLALGWLGHISVLLVLLVLFRDIIIVTGAVMYHVYIGKVSIKPVMISKLNTLLQIVLVVLLLFHLSEVSFSKLISAELINVFVLSVYVSTIASGVIYIWLWGRRAVSEKNKGKQVI